MHAHLMARLAAVWLVALASPAQDDPPVHATVCVSGGGTTSADRTSDHVVTTTNARGEFRAMILPGIPYNVRALEEKGDEVLLSPAQWTRTTPVVLESRATVKRLRVTIAGLDAWREGAGTLQFWVSPDLRRQICVPFDLAASGATAVPTLRGCEEIQDTASENIAAAAPRLGERVGGGARQASRFRHTLSATAST